MAAPRPLRAPAECRALPPAPHIRHAGGGGGGQARPGGSLLKVIILRVILVFYLIYFKCGEGFGVLWVFLWWFWACFFFLILLLRGLIFPCGFGESAAGEAEAGRRSLREEAAPPPASQVITA